MTRTLGIALCAVIGAGLPFLNGIQHGHPFDPATIANMVAGATTTIGAYLQIPAAKAVPSTSASVTTEATTPKEATLNMANAFQVQFSIPGAPAAANTLLDQLIKPINIPVPSEIITAVNAIETIAGVPAGTYGLQATVTEITETAPATEPVSA